MGWMWWFVWVCCKILVCFFVDLVWCWWLCVLLSFILFSMVFWKNLLILVVISGWNIVCVWIMSLNLLCWKEFLFDWFYRGGLLLMIWWCWYVGWLLELELFMCCWCGWLMRLIVVIWRFCCFVISLIFVWCMCCILKKISCCLKCR